MAPAAAATAQAGACGAMAVLDRDAPKPGRGAASLVAGDPPRPPGGNASDAEDWEDAVGSESSEDEPEAGGMQFELQDIMEQGGTWVPGQESSGLFAAWVMDCKTSRLLALGRLGIKQLQDKLSQSQGRGSRSSSAVGGCLAAEVADLRLPVHATLPSQQTWRYGP